MNATILAATLLFTAPLAAQTNSPVSHDKPSNTFLTGTESVLDNALATSITLPDAEYRPHFAQLKASRDNLSTMASNDAETDLIASLDNLIFMISSCHLQAGDPTRAAACQTKLDSLEKSLMTQIGAHKSGAAWVAGPPA